jgi:threonine dehydratase
MGIRCTTVVPDHAPAAKLAAIRRLGCSIVKVPAADRFGVVLEGRQLGGMEGFFFHPVTEPTVVAGHGKVVCIVSGGNTDTGQLVTIL